MKILSMLFDFLVIVVSVALAIRSYHASDWFFMVFGVVCALFVTSVLTVRILYPEKLKKAEKRDD